jgi:hypothetical protein
MFNKNLISRIISFHYIILITQYTLHHVYIFLCYLKKKKINKDNFLLCCSAPKKIKNLELELNKQISKFLKYKNRKIFIYIEVGVFLGDTTCRIGKILKNKLKKNFKIITIDPFIPYSGLSRYEFNIRSVYKYFRHNISIEKLDDNLEHFKIKSTEAYKKLRNKIFFDFCYIDGSHKYYDVKNDIKNFKNLIVKSKKYSGLMMGDDFNYSYDELLKFNNDLFLLKKLKRKYLYYDSQVNFYNRYFFPGVTFAIKDLNLRIKKTKTGLWKYLPS